MPFRRKFRSSPFRLLSILVFISLAQNIYAQGDKIKLDAYVYSAANNKPLAYATVSVLRQDDSSHVAFGLTDREGLVVFDGLRPEFPYNLLFYYTGYEVARIPFFSIRDTMLDTVFLNTSTRSIDELVVLAERPPLIIRNDTMEFNASAFRTLPDALVEDLLNKLPGIDKDENGQLMVNGKKVTKLLVDGKQFFGSDPAIALRNLPADAIDKVQITEDVEESRMNVGATDAEETVVINLTIKKGMKKGYFGKLYGGGGRSAGNLNLYEGGGIVNMFRDTFQVSFIGFGNNTNKQAFSFEELSSLGGFDRTGVDRWMTSGSGVQIGNVSLGGAREGINASSGGGINLNHNIERSYLNFQYFYGSNNAEINKTSNVVQNLVDSTITNTTVSSSESQFQSHRFALKWEFDKDTLTSIELSANAGLRQDASALGSGSIVASDQHVLNDNQIHENRDYSNNEFSFNARMNKVSADQKWTHVSRLMYTREETLNERFTDIHLNYYQMEIPTDSIQRQFRLNDNLSNETSLFLSSHYEITDSIYIGFRYNGIIANVANENKTFNRNYSEEYLDSNLSNRVNSETLRNDLEFSTSFVFPKFRLNPFVVLTSYRQDNSYGLQYIDGGINDIVYRPGLRIRVDNLSFSYEYEYEPPEVYELNPLLNNSNLNNQERGNPDLASERSHQFSAFTNKYNTKTMLYHYLYFTANFYSNAIVNSQEILESGIIVNKPVNAQKSSSFYGGGSLRKTYKYENKNSLSLLFSMWTNYSRSPMIINGVSTDYMSINLRPKFSVDVNIKDIIEFSQLFAYSYRNTASVRDDLLSNTYTSSTAVILRWPSRVMWRASFDINYTDFSSANIPVNEYQLLHAEVFLNLDKNGKWQLNLKAYDILKQNQSINTWSYGNVLSFRQSDVLQQYFLASLVYNIKSFKGNDVKVRDRGIWWW